MKTSASADLCLEKVLNTCSRSANQMPGTENVLDFFFFHVAHATVYVSGAIKKKRRIKKAVCSMILERSETSVRFPKN